ncbi:unnamed protein product [Urochloa humidicola]
MDACRYLQSFSGLRRSSLQSPSGFAGQPATSCLYPATPAVSHACLLTIAPRRRGVLQERRRILPPSDGFGIPHAERADVPPDPHTHAAVRFAAAMKKLELHEGEGSLL